MMSKPSKSERKEDRLQQLERQLAEQKKKNAELQKQKTIRLDDEQVESILDNLTQRIECSINRAVGEKPHPILIDPIEQRKGDIDGFSHFLKWIIAVPFFLLAISIIYFLFTKGGQYWAEGWAQRFALIFVAITGFDCFLLGIEILKEKDRNYIVALFSALVALVALIVTLVK